jgi:hypothetical protein
MKQLPLNNSAGSAPPRNSDCSRITVKLHIKMLRNRGTTSNSGPTWLSDSNDSHHNTC